MIQPLFVFYDWGLLALRLALGIILVAHGYPKLKNLKGTGEWLASIGFRPGALWAAAAVAVELVGGLMLIAGFLTQLAALAVLLQFLLIILKVNRAKGLVGGFELDLLIATVALLLATAGGGLWSADQAAGVLLFY